MAVQKLRSNSGITLVEVTFAVAVFAIAIAMSAQALVSFYAATNVQEQRISAMQANRAVISALRQKRVDFQETTNNTDIFKWQDFFTWVNTQQSAGWESFIKDDAAAGLLPGHSITVTLTAMDGDPANPGDDPIQVHVRSTWQDLRGRDAVADLVAAISER